MVVKELTREVVVNGKRQRAVRGLTEVESSMGEQNPEVNITIDRIRAAAFGISVSEITDVVRQKVKGEKAGRFDAPEEQIDIRIQLEEEDRATLEKLKRISIPSTEGDIRLEQVARIEKGEGPATITRSENSRVALIRANLHDRPLGDVVSDIRTILENTELPSGCIWRITGQSEEMERSVSSLYLAAALAILLVYIVLASQFESIVHPFVIMFCVPFSLVGLALILTATGQTINIFSLIGMLMMVGIAVNDAIVLVTTINQRRDDGMERIEAIVEAGKSRLRPIMITTLTTTLGMVPMAIALGPGSELRSPMAITVIGGLLSSTFFTLTTIPCIYLLLDKILPRSYKPGKSGVEKISSPEPKE
jgi:hydrophobic/amphiphilic exporter-1 (mainly G- bacteria), HAE1 family